MMPGRFCQMADGVDDHQRAFPAMRLVFAPDPAVLVAPFRQFLRQPLDDFGLRIGLVLDPVAHCNLPRVDGLGTKVGRRAAVLRLALPAKAAIMAAGHLNFLMH